MEAFGISHSDLQQDVNSHVAQGTLPSVFDTANTTEDKFKWDRRENLLYYDQFDVE
jgi:hypothetical protein